MLTAGGYIDTNAGSSTYGEFSIEVNKLNLYQFDVGIRQKLRDVKALVDDNADCTTVLEQFYSGKLSLHWSNTLHSSPWQCLDRFCSEVEPTYP